MDRNIQILVDDVMMMLILDASQQFTTHNLNLFTTVIIAIIY
jgi:hypothetical protein